MSPAKRLDASSAQAETLFGFLLEFQKMLNKEARADRAASRADQKLELAAKQAKLDLERARIEQMQTEARERYERATENARLAGGLGIAPGTVPDLFREYEASLDKASDRMQRLIDEQEKEIEAASRRTAGSDADYKASRDRRRQGLDNIQKLLDIIHSMNPQL